MCIIISITMLIMITSIVVSIIMFIIIWAVRDTSQGPRSTIGSSSSRSATRAMILGQADASVDFCAGVAWLVVPPSVRCLRMLLQSRSVLFPCVYDNWCAICWSSGVFRCLSSPLLSSPLLSSPLLSSPGMSCLMSHVSCLMSHVSCLMSHVSCLMSHVSCLMSHVSCLMSHVSCLMCDCRSHLVTCHDDQHEYAICSMAVDLQVN